MDYTLTYYYIRYHKNGTAWVYPKPYKAIITMDTCKKLMKHCYGTCKTKLDHKKNKAVRLDFRCYNVFASTPEDLGRYKKLHFVSAQNGNKSQTRAWDNFVKLGIPDKQKG